MRAGQAATHSPHWMHRDASRRASSSAYPITTSAHVPTRSDGSSMGMGTRAGSTMSNPSDCFQPSVNESHGFGSTPGVNLKTLGSSSTHTYSLDMPSEPDGHTSTQSAHQQQRP